MARQTPARTCAVAVLGEVRRREAHARDLLLSNRRLVGLSQADRALATRLVLGATAAAGLLDHILGRHVRGRLEPQVRDALRVSAYELLFLSTPTHAAVSQGVELVRAMRPRAAGMANAVLRRVVDEDVPMRRTACARVEAGSHDVDDLALVSGYPKWILQRVATERGYEEARDVACSALGPAPVYVTANRALVGADAARQLLEEAGLNPTDTGLVGSFSLGRPSALFETNIVHQAQVVIADLSAQRVVRKVSPKRGERVLEVGQGRGTKTILLQNEALASGGPAHVVGLDDEAFKTRVSAERMARAGLSKWVRCLTYDARLLAQDKLPEPLAGSFDVVFVDAPCSGTGTLRRHPEIAWRLAASSMDASHDDSLPALQLRMLGAAASRVRSGGVLCYATCSLLRAENEEVVAAFLGGERGQDFVVEGETLRTTPRADGPDGHFCVRLRRVC